MFVFFCFVLFFLSFTCYQFIRPRIDFNMSLFFCYIDVIGIEKNQSYNINKHTHFWRKLNNQFEGGKKLIKTSKKNQFKSFRLTLSNDYFNRKRKHFAIDERAKWAANKKWLPAHNCHNNNVKMSFQSIDFIVKMSWSFIEILTRHKRNSKKQAEPSDSESNQRQSKQF